MTDGDCGKIFARLSEYVDRELDARDCVELERHLSGCPPCIEFVESLRQSIRLCGQYGECEAPPAPGAEAMAALRQAFEKMTAERRGGA